MGLSEGANRRDRVGEVVHAGDRLVAEGCVGQENDAFMVAAEAVDDVGQRAVAVA